MIIGWDIGIKNLAYCLIRHIDEDNNHKVNDYNEKHCFIFNNKKYEICDWGIINIMDQVHQHLENDGEIILTNRPKLKCKLCISKGGKYLKNAVYCKEETNNNEYYGLCANHFKKLNYIRLPKVEPKSTCYWCKEDTHDKDNKMLLTCDKKGVFTLKNNVYITYCTKHKNELLKNKTINDTDILKIKNIKKTTSINLTILGESLFKQLKQNDNLLLGETVLLENQPVLKNPTMKSVQMFVYSYYILNGIMDTTKNVKTIQCYNANKKTELIHKISPSDKKDIEHKIKDVKNKYTKNKKTAIYLVEIILKDNHKWFSYFKDHKKKDDLADSLLMSLHYLTK